MCRTRKPAARLMWMLWLAPDFCFRFCLVLLASAEDLFLSSISQNGMLPKLLLFFFLHLTASKKKKMQPMREKASPLGRKPACRGGGGGGGGGLAHVEGKASPWRKRLASGGVGAGIQPIEGKASPLGGKPAYGDKKASLWGKSQPMWGGGGGGGTAH